MQIGKNRRTRQCAEEDAKVSAVTASAAASPKPGTSNPSPSSRKAFGVQHEAERPAGLDPARSPHRARLFWLRASFMQIRRHAIRNANGRGACRDRRNPVGCSLDKIDLTRLWAARPPMRRRRPGPRRPEVSREPPARRARQDRKTKACRTPCQDLGEDCCAIPGLYDGMIANKSVFSGSSGI